MTAQLTGLEGSSQLITTPRGTFEAVVRLRRDETPDVMELVVETACGSPLPEWAPGAHVDLHTPFGIKQYSLCSEVANRAEWRLGIRRSDSDSGRWIQETCRPGHKLTMGLPRNNFSLASHKEYVFIAGGIGVTPLLPMLHQAVKQQQNWKLFFSAPGQKAFAFRHLLPDSPSRIVLWDSTRQGRLDFEEIIANLDADGAVYACGPQPMTDSLLHAAKRHSRETSVFFERFGAQPQAPAGPETDFSIELARTGTKVRVAAGQTALEAITSTGTFIPSSCRTGICGSCEVAVLSGDIDHRDSMLDDSERAANDCFFPCVSRAKSGDLVVDL